ncbi:tyrosine-type recombinase/integrase [Sphingomonas sp. J315]|uniref:tyrosine-type recombinase/integrase n=1 Tax=Sphingomonas sp. J315 TaxID=2898433 RepID=UPI0021ADE0E9|nr:integrase arm-type DNA-binding domain-containing protein [Sphingomonas sp. J315]UUY00959.1 integrase arm-type DNA-binding domain-containing protein [Sphingomonas sp. J315]
MRIRNKLNVKQLAGLRSPGVYSDGGGLYLRVRSSGSRSWLYIYSLHSQRREMGLGSDLDVTLANAREKAAAARELVLAGIDPQRARITAKASAPEKSPMTFGEFATDLIDSIEDGFKNPKHRQQWRNTLTTYAASLFPVPIADVSTTHVLEALKPIWLSKAETASRVRQRIERVLDAAKVKGLRSGENPARGRGHLDLLLPKRPKADVKHHAALPFNQVAGFVKELRQKAGMAARALEFTILTAARSGEIRGMTWREIDLEGKLWTVPASRMKAGASHEVPPERCGNRDPQSCPPRNASARDDRISRCPRRYVRHDAFEGAEAYEPG